ncbi:uncharacterized protein L201_000204 [Kwoniella dendrophila CBS 6074]|uniref:Uncharacterized protein n=1 Tax=Kwoniella dendrophila CBS 6074 TaxID=1295534 RepID=A0AAX4JK17_9TREE
MAHLITIRSSASQKIILRAIHNCAKREAKEPTTSRGKGKAKESLFAPLNRTDTPVSPSRIYASSTSSSSSSLSSSIPKLTSGGPQTHTRAWREFENSWKYQSFALNSSSSSSSSSSSNSSAKDKKDINDNEILEIRTIFEKPSSYNPLSRLLGAGFTAFIGFQWFWLPENEEPYQTFWNHKPETGFATLLWGSIKNILFFQTPYWALGGAALSIWMLTKRLNIVTKLEQCKMRPTLDGSDQIYLRMSTLKQALIGRLSKEPRLISLSDVIATPVSGPHQRNGDLILNLYVKDSKKPKFSDGHPYIVDTRISKFIEQSDKPYVLSPSRLRHIFGKLEI